MKSLKEEFKFLDISRGEEHPVSKERATNAFKKMTTLDFFITLIRSLNVIIFPGPSGC